jgi:2-polyprenyl-3-methyl-5-hydroxy-6-metoxy-1,4-benzoquinol methylase
MKLLNCRSCHSKKLLNLFSLGKIHFTGKFSKFPNKVKKGELGLVICSYCKLVQLNTNFDLKYLYGPDYGYRTGINNTMTIHVRDLVKKLSKKYKVKKGDAVLDIASNDGTLLNFYNKNIITFGIDPLIKKYIKFYKKINYKVSNFFNYKYVSSKYQKKFKIITALSVFYDAQKPVKFLKDIEKLLDKEGIAVIEFADLESIIKYNMFDTICHEHLEYYSTKVLLNMINNNNLKLIDIKTNKINGSSKQYYICKKNATHQINSKIIKKIILSEAILNLEKKNTYVNFKKKIDKVKTVLKNKIIEIKKRGKTIHGYGASTKGNVLLQYFELDNTTIDYIAERNPKKYNYYTPGSKIKIISENKSRSLKPDYYLVLPWHFKKEIIKREKNTINRGSSFIFPLPNIQTVSQN